MNMASSLKRILKTNEDLSNKRVKICTEIGHFYEVQSNKNVLTVGRNSSDYWRSSYQRYRLSCYGGYSGRKRCVKNRIGSKKKVVDGKKENIKKAEYSNDIKNSENIEVSGNTEDIKNTDSVTIEELVDWQPTVGSEAFNEGFEVSDLNGIEAAEEGEVFNSVCGEDEGEKIIIFNNDDEEVLEVLEVILMRTMMNMKRDEALNRKLNFGNSESCRVMYKLWKFSCKNVLF